jgi:hypothetical protein
VCSACSNDDLSREIASGFAVSSPANRAGFAFLSGERRRHYRTLAFLRNVRKVAFLQGILRVCVSRKPHGAYDFAHLANRDISLARREKRTNSESEDLMRRDLSGKRAESAAREPLEIRVSGDAIIEVFGSSCDRHVAAWEIGAEGYQPARHVQSFRPTRGVVPGGLSLTRQRQFAERHRFARSTRAWRATLAYAIFCAATVLVVWFLLR